MKIRNLTSIFAGVLAIFCVCAGLASAASGNGAGLERVPVLIGFRQVPGPSEQALVRSHGGAIKYSYTLVPAIAASIPEAAIEGLRRNPNVTVVERDIEVFAVADQLPWGVDRIDAELVHAGGNKGAGVKVAIIDSGIDYNHSDLNDNYKGGKDFVNNDDDPMDDNGHGTHCAGIVAAEDDGSGVVGVAPRADIYGLKVLGANGSGNYSAVIAALQWAVAHGMQVTSNSYGSSGDPGTLVKQAFDNAEAAGIVNVCAAGNSGNRAGTGDNVIYPGRYASCIAVAATNSSDTRASFSSTGPTVEISAPGVYIRSTYPGGGYVYMSGTSMACPHVAGVAALAIATGVADVRGALAATADDLGAADRDPLYGYGLVDADEAAAGEGVTDNRPTVTVTNPADGATVLGEITVTADASDDNGVTQVDFFVDGGSIGTDTTAPYATSWNSASVGDGPHTIMAIATDTIGQTASDSIAVTVDNVDDPPFVVILSPTDGATVSGTVNVSAIADDDKGVTQVQFFVNGGSIGVDTTAPYAVSWDSTSLGNGSHTITATATDTISQTYSDSIGVTVNNSAPPVMHVAGIEMALKKAGPTVSGIATVTVVDGDGAVAGATVYGQWSDATSDSDVGTTDTLGRVTLQSDKIKKPASGTTFTFTVTNVVKSGWGYDPAGNVETTDWAVVP